PRVFRRPVGRAVVAALVLVAGASERSATALEPDRALTQLGHRFWDDELPQSSVNAITQTRDGYLWFGTYEGLVRFDGVRFVVFDSVGTRDLPGTAVARRRSTG
ncbi:MAG TPA: two-component regulator propeller domain-containing protein, partial [Longimicrobiales bacterium]|nr:two-component regulator propeller domain-containing protein [Longimicrobiales bacterium]